MRTSMIGAAALLTFAAACASGEDAGAPATSSSSTSSTTRGSATSTSSPTTTGPASTTIPQAPQTCTSSEGFSVEVPAGWVVNDGSVVPPCSQFHRDDFTVPAGTDERVAAITAYREAVPYSTAAQPQEGEDRAVTAVDGRQAVRLAYEFSGEGLYPAGTPITSYIVDLGEETLFLDTIGTPAFDYEANVEVVDRMAQTLTITDPAVDTDPSLVATYLGGGGGFSVSAESTSGQVCLRIPPGGEAVCTEAPDDDQVHTIALRDLGGRVQAGVTGADVWRVDLRTPSGETHSYLPAEVPATDLGAYAFVDTIDAFESLVLKDLSGRTVRTVTPGAA